VADHQRDIGRYVFVAFITVIFLVLVYYLLQEIPHATRPTLHTVTTITASPSG
jgi:hypothetical protein